MLLWPWSKFKRLNCKIAYWRTSYNDLLTRHTRLRKAVTKLRSRVGSSFGVSGESKLIGDEETFSPERQIFKKVGLDEILQMIDDLP